MNSISALADEDDDDDDVEKVSWSGEPVGSKKPSDFFWFLVGKPKCNKGRV